MEFYLKLLNHIWDVTDKDGNWKKHIGNDDTVYIKNVKNKHMLSDNYIESLRKWVAEQKLKSKKIKI